MTVIREFLKVDIIKLIDALLEGIEVRLNTDFFTERTRWEDVADCILFTGCIDEYFDYQCGHLEYRSLRFEEKNTGNR